MGEVAAKRHGKALDGRAIAARAVAHRASHPQVAPPVGHLRHLRQDLAGARERLVDVPQRAGAADPREMEIGRRLPFRDIAGAVDPDEEERHAAGLRPLQCREPVAGGLEADAEAARQQLDVIALGLGRLDEGAIGQDQRAGEVIRQADAQQAARLVAFHAGLAGEPVDLGALFQKGDLRRDLEGALTGAQPGGQVQHPRCRVVATQRGRVFVKRDADAVPPGEPVGQPLGHPPGAQAAADRLGRLVEARDVVALHVEPVAHRLERGGRSAEPADDAPVHQVDPLGVLAQPRLHRDDRAGDAGHVGGELAQLDHRGAGALIGECRTQIGDQPRLLGFGEELHVQPEDRVQLQQHRHRQRALVLLHLVQIARAEFKRAGERDLGHAVVLAQPAQPHPHEGLLHLSILRNIRKTCGNPSQT
ncbi:hypothetical protein SDC9_45234 [bioreactor metagenome]|uniref:Uncharacterized protein n=1 Tax=bioreactor metagenome TaxID=1076179 RepID=A0A644W5L8_9ZZZZ